MLNYQEFCIVGENFACEHGKKWTVENTDYQIFRYNQSLIVSAKCNTPEFHIGDEKFTSCEHGRIPTRLPKCRYGKGKVYFAFIKFYFLLHYLNLFVVNLKIFIFFSC